MTFKPKLEWHY